VSDRVSEALRELIDQQAIIAVLNDYARALDTRDWELLASLFTLDALVDYTAEGGPLCRGPDAVVADCQADFDGLEATQHLIGNVTITVAGDHADATCYVHAWHYSAAAQDGTTLLLVGGYRDRLARTGGTWKIVRRSLEVAFQSGNLGVKGGRSGPQTASGGSSPRPTRDAGLRAPAKNPAAAPPSTT
jgi:3-phenylpropionate/cinnamic acid dioxygenase small subunit